MATVLIMALKEESQQLFEKNQIQPQYCGVGLVKAGYLTLKLISEQSPAHIINLGTAGSFSHEKGTLVECTSFVQRVPNPLLPFKARTLHSEGITDLPKAVCGSADYIENGVSLVPCDVMDMEAYAIAFVCQQKNIKFTSIKYVTDHSNENTRNDWQQNLKSAAEKLLEQYLKITGIQKREITP